MVFTGVSGSGKSSLAFGTLYAEEQRRYLQSVAPYAAVRVLVRDVRSAVVRAIRRRRSGPGGGTQPQTAGEDHAFPGQK